MFVIIKPDAIEQGLLYPILNEFESYKQYGLIKLPKHFWVELYDHALDEMPIAKWTEMVDWLSNKPAFVINANKVPSNEILKKQIRYKFKHTINEYKNLIHISDYDKEEQELRLFHDVLNSQKVNQAGGWYGRD